MDNLEPDDGLIWVHDAEGETPAFTEFGIGPCDSNKRIRRQKAD